MAVGCPGVGFSAAQRCHGGLVTWRDASGVEFDNDDYSIFIFVTTVSVVFWVFGLLMWHLRYVNPQFPGTRLIN